MVSTSANGGAGAQMSLLVDEGGLDTDRRGALDDDHSGEEED
jgi:hypothetical protein